MKYFLFNLNFWFLKIPSQPPGQGKHLCIIKILEILKIKFRKIKISGPVTLAYLCSVINHSFRPLGLKIDQIHKNIELKTNC